MITLTEFKDKNEILKNEELQKETGYGFLKNGTAVVSMTCPMPGITVDMINWWFWWHPQASERYRAWYPGDHKAVGYARKNREYFNQKSLPEFQPNTQYPTETIGGSTMPLQIDFVRPEEFGFDREVMRENNIPLIVCGHVGIRSFVKHTEMAHIFKQTDDGLFLISRFWMGQLLWPKILRKIIINEKLAKGMTEHCHQEYRNLAAMLPDLYNENR